MSEEGETMKSAIKLVVPMTCALLCAAPAAMAADGSDAGFNSVAREMVGRDTGSGWFDYYVVNVNQEIAFRDSNEPYGAAGPNGPLKGFDGYLSSFVPPDTGSIWFNDYVDDLGRELQLKGGD
jgi:hypothetical protein